MIIDQQTNKLYLSALIKEIYPQFHQNLAQKLDSIGITINYLNNTKDIWCRDYMPIQVSEKWFVQFKFNPCYLNFKKYDKIRTNPKAVWDEMKLKVVESNIVLDGGNVVKWFDKAIITDRILKDNPGMSVSALYFGIKHELGVSQLTVIPELKKEMTGHADGILRFIEHDHLVINDFSKIDAEYAKKLKLCLLCAGFTFIELPNEFEKAENEIDDRGDYVNFLEMENLVLIPAYNSEMDAVAELAYKEIFRDKKAIESIDCSEIAKEGGALNCITWNLKH
jgi:agmatine deiminase